MTTKKIKLLFNRQENAETTCPGSTLTELIQQYFDLEEYDPTKSYNRAECVLMVRLVNKDLWWQPLQQQGFKMIIDNSHEVPEAVTQFWVPVTDPRYLEHKPVPESAFVLNVPDYCWYLESARRWKSGHHLYSPRPQYKYKALLTMNREKPHRTELLTQLNSELDQCLWSYVQQGHLMPNDVIGPPEIWERYINTDWYDQCCFSIVAESMAEPFVADRVPLISEKTWKAVSMQHPFMVVGELGTLEHMHRLGFETFENIWDESYDHTQDIKQRVAQVVANVVQYTKEPLDQLTLQKIQHNHARFYDQTAITQAVVKHIINPIYEYVSTQT
jgi:hypothetical protein